MIEMDPIAENCPFCSSLLDDSEPILIRTEHCFMLGYRESHLAGVLIIPNRHVESPFDLTPEEWNDHLTMIQRAREILSAQNPDGYNIGWNVGGIGGQHVFHAHLHVVARFSDEPYAGKGIRHWIKSDENRRGAI